MNRAGIRLYPPGATAAVAAGSLPSIPSWRQWGHSWTGGFDDPRGETGFPERLAGTLGVSGTYFENWGLFGTSLMDATSGAGYYLHNTTEPSAYNAWPWEPYHGIDGFLFGVNDFGTRHVTGMLTGPWPTQRDMWREVWRQHWRSVIQRSIAGGVYPAERSMPTNLADPTTGSHPTILYGPPGAWVFQPTIEATSTGYWRTGTSGATVTITIPADYDTGYVAFRHFVPGSYFPGTQTMYGADGTGPYAGLDGNTVPVASRPAMILGAAASETFLAPVNVTIASTGLPSIVQDCRLLRNRRAYSSVTVNNTMFITNRMAVPATPGTTRTVTLTVGTMPAGGFYGFDAWEIEAKAVNRSPVVVANVADPAWWTQIYLLGVDTWPGIMATAQLASDDVATVCAEWGDPGICVADIRTALASDPLDYSSLWATGVTPATGAPMVGDGDGTHPHSIGSRLIAGAFRDALVAAALPSSRYAQPFTPTRDMVRA